jgi:S-adenosylmethionine:tRNA ribosyltransferase-isomerase
MKALFAPVPPEERGLARDEVRLLVGTPDGLTHAVFRDIGDHLRPGDLLVVNNSATVAAEDDAVLRGRGPVVLHVATPLDDGRWVIELRTAPDAAEPVLDAAPGDRVDVDGSRLRLLEGYPYDRSSPSGAGNRLWLAEQLAGTPVTEQLARQGRPIAYGYLRGRFPLAAYQTVFGLVPGSAEMPSAARPFTHQLVTRLVAGGVLIAPVTLHTGVSSQESGEGPQPERYVVSAATAAVVNHVRESGGRVVAVGTTSTRALESAADIDGVVHPAAGWTDLVIGPHRPVRVVGGLITGWHDPQASHLMLVQAVAGRALTRAAYDAAYTEDYLWHEFGDSALLLPGRAGERLTVMNRN